MFWLRRPPYLRWSIAGLILLLGLVVESRSAPTVRYPFTGSFIAAGTAIDDDIVWRDIPAGLLPAWPGSIEGPAATAIEAASPLLPASVATTAIPVDWWAVSIPLPSPVAPGVHIRVVLSDGTVIEGIVIDGDIDTGFSTAGTVAFPPTDAPLVAASASNDALVVMIAASGSVPPPDG